jgi:hypothetical protein
MAAKKGRQYTGQAEDLSTIVNLEEKLVQLGKENFGAINKMLGATQDLAKISKTITEEGKLQEGISKDKVKTLLDELEASEEMRDAIMDTAPGVFSIAAGAKKGLDNFKLMAKSSLGIVAIVSLAVKAFLDFQKAVTDTRKELGVSYTQAVAITAQNKVLAQVAKGYGLELDDITSAQAAIRKDLGASVQESINLSLSFARTSAATGQTAEELSSTLSLMESISSASRDVLLNQIRTNAAMIEAAGVAPSLVMKDIAQNAEFFASFAKDGGQNLIGAGVAARKLGLSMDAVKGITESLLDFETSIEGQLEASLLLGRQINLDKARQLAFTGDQEGMMREILKQVGGEAEFTRMTYLQRQSLAKSVGVSVEQLSRLVRNNTAGGTAGAVGAAMGGTNVYSDPESHRLLNRIARNTD